MAKRLILIRHGQVEERYAGRFLGSTDADLSPAGLRQGADLASWLAGKQPGACFSSPMRRCTATARAATAGLSLPLELDPDLREVDFGAWEGLSFADIAGRDAAAVDRWARFEPGFRFPGGESVADFLKRITAAADRMAAVPRETVVAFTHGGVIRFLLCALLRLDPRSYAAFDIRPACVVELGLFEGGALLQFLGNVGELAPKSPSPPLPKGEEGGLEPALHPPLTPFSRGGTLELHSPPLAKGDEGGLEPALQPPPPRFAEGGTPRSAGVA